MGLPTKPAKDLCKAVLVYPVNMAEQVRLR